MDTIHTVYADFSDVYAQYESICSGGWFVLNTEEGEVAVFHGVRGMQTLDRVAFYKRDIMEVRAWLSEDKSRKLFCCYSAYLPEDIRERALIEFDGPVYLHSNGCKYLNKNGTQMKLEYIVDFDDMLCEDYCYDEDDLFIYGTKFSLESMGIIL